MEQEKRFIPILSDYGFKITFANEKNTLFLRKAIQALIQSSVPIETVTLARNEFAGITKDSRGGLYDLICVDESQTTFIVEMQLGVYNQFIQRSKFYAFQRFNTLIIKGKYKFENIPKIYCIGFLAKDLFPFQNYYHFCQLKNQENQIIDEQMFHILVEINKFTKEKQEIKNDLDKLIYTMKNIHLIQDPIEFPEFWTEEWIEIAIQQLDKHQLTPEQRADYEMIMAHNASVVSMIENQIKDAVEEKVKEAVEEKVKEAEEKAKEAEEKVKEAEEKAKEAVEEKVKEAEEKVKEAERQKAKTEKIATIEKLLQLQMFSLEQISQITNTSMEEIEKIKKNS